MERLSGLDATFLYLETPTHHMHVAATMVIDPSTMPGGYSFEKIKQFIAGRLHLVPPFTRRIMQVPFRVHHPVWVEDPDFRLDHHIRRISAPAPGGRRELAEVAGQVASTQLDRSRPLWELWVVEGLKHGRIGIVTKVHHAAIDGASGAELMVHLFDLEPVAPDPDPPEREPERIPSELELLGYASLSRTKRNLGLLPLLGSTVRSVNRVARGRRSPEHLVGAVPLTAPRTPWNDVLGTRRQVGLARVPLADVKEIKTHFGVTVNDVVLGLVGGTLRRYLETHGGVPEEPLLAACPVSVRTEDDATGGNKVSAMFTSLATDIDDAGARLKAIHEVTKGAKEEHNAIGADMLGNWAEFAGPNLVNLAARLYSNLGLAGSHRPIHNVIISNVPGPDFPLYYAGAELVAAYPMGPVMEGAGLNVTVMSYRGNIDIGFMVDEDLVPDVWEMADAVEPAMEELRTAAGLRSAPAKRPASRRPAKRPAKKRAAGAAG
jgi:diacylglycerol O-acyltransferase / wax synthase